MSLFGFSTGALALGDFRRALELLQGVDADAVELSALREKELPDLMQAAGELDLSQFEYVAVHAPSRLAAMTEVEASNLLLPCIDRGWNVVLHPDVVRDFGCWRPFGPRLCSLTFTVRAGPAVTRPCGSLVPVPRISQFYGIVIAMYYDDHAPPHFHAYYSGEEATFRIADLFPLEGHLPRRAMSLVREWAAQHRPELEANWRKARDAEPLDKIPGLE